VSGGITSVGGINIADNQLVNWGDSSVYIRGNGVTDLLYFGSGNIDRMRLGTGANLMLIGGSSAGAANPALQWAGPDEIARAYISYHVDSPGAAADEMKFFQQYGFKTFYAGGIERMRITNDGKVGIGTPAPVTSLHVDSPGSEVIRISSSPGYPYISWFGAGADARGYIGLGSLTTGAPATDFSVRAVDNLWFSAANGNKTAGLNATGKFVIGPPDVGAAGVVLNASGSSMSPSFETGGGDGVVNTIPYNSGSGGGLVIIRGANGNSGDAFARVYIYANQVPGGFAASNMTLIASIGSPGVSFTMGRAGGFVTIAASGTEGGLWHVTYFTV
jgi:hypothetical protein